MNPENQVRKGQRSGKFTTLVSADGAPMGMAKSTQEGIHYV
jgi:hypothetical protein